MKESWKPGTLIYPLPAVLVSCGATPEEYNLLTVAWTGTVCPTPPMCYISVRPERHSYEIIRRTREFVINLTTRDLARAADWCGVRSGRDYDKFREMGLTPGKALQVAAPIVEEAPVSIECRVRQVLELGTHDMFLAEVVSVQVDADYIDPATGYRYFSTRQFEPLNTIRYLRALDMPLRDIERVLYFESYVVIEGVRSLDGIGFARFLY